MPFVSVVIPTCNRNESLAACLRSLAPGRQTLSAEEYEVVVSDDGVAGPAREMMAKEFPWARWTQGPRRGPASNRNHGAAEAAGEWVAFTDDDCLASAGWLQAYVEGARARMDLDVMEGRTLAAGVRESIDMEAPVNTHGGFLWSCNFAIRRVFFERLGGFDTGFPGAAMEDVEFCTRLREAGAPLVFVSGAVVEHPWRPRKGLRFIHVYARSVDYFVQKHPGQAACFRPNRLARVWAGQIWRTTREAFRSCGGRGILRTVWLDSYTFVLLAWRGLRR